MRSSRAKPKESHYEGGYYRCRFPRHNHRRADNQGGKPIDLFDSYKDNVDALNRSGATITGAIDLNVPVTAYTPDQMTGEYDLVFLLTKQTNNRIVLPQLLPHLHRDSVVCTLQNGIPEDLVASIVGRERTIGGAVGFGATWLKPGVSSLTSSYAAVEKFAFEIGEIDGVVRPRLKVVRDYLECVGTTEIRNNLMGIRFAKVLMNSTFSGMSAALGCTFGDVLANPKAMTCLAFVANECIAVARARGVRLVEMQGEDLEFFELNSAADIPVENASLPEDLGTAREAESEHAAGPGKGPRMRNQLHQRRDLPATAANAAWRLRSTTRSSSLSLRRRIGAG